VELGIWLSGLESFLTQPSAWEGPERSRLITSVLERCVWLTARLSIQDRESVLSGQELSDLARVLRESILIGGSRSRGQVSGSGEVQAWCRVLRQRTEATPAFQKLIAHAEACGESHLPEPLKSLAAAPPENEERAELALVLPRFGRILKWLTIVGQMLEADEPLKPALVVFACINEQMAELIAYMNNRLERFPNEQAELFGSLDAASYTASIEFKKVFSPEFGALISVRPAQSVYAVMETAYSMLNQSLQQILTGFAVLVDPSVDAASFFPTSQLNFERSIVLRRELWELVQLTQAAEDDPEKPHVDALDQALRKFINGSLHFLFYKDTETFERFVEEIMVTKQAKDLVPILHRFRAYLETLFGQVNLRAVFEKHPFEHN